MKSLSLVAVVALAACVAPGNQPSSTSSSGVSSAGSTGGADPGCASGSCAIGSVCNPDQDTDPCAAQGLACSPDYTGVSPTGAFCELPGPYFDCLPSVGCAASTPALQCLGADDAGDPGGCFVPCTTSADCWDPLTVCASMEAGGPTYCVLNSCDDFWQTCSASSVSGADGTCVYVYTDPQYGPQGACLQGGSVPNGGACNFYRGPDAGLCTPGTLCMIDAHADNSGDCMAVCDGVADGGPACAGDCVLSEPPAPPPAVSALDFTQAGGCGAFCSSSGTCPSPLTCYDVGTTTDINVCLP
jgi:hypothetical protein